MWLTAIVILIISMIVSGTLRSKFSGYSKIALSSGLTGKEVAEKMLRESGIYDVKVVSVSGYLADQRAVYRFSCGSCPWMRARGSARRGLFLANASQPAGSRSTVQFGHYPVGFTGWNTFNKGFSAGIAGWNYPFCVNHTLFTHHLTRWVWCQ